MLLTTTDLYTLLYPEVIAEIARQDDTLVPTAMNAAMDEVRLYLGRYDTTALLGTDHSEPTAPSPLLKKYCVAISCWNLVALCNPGIHYDHIKANYEQTIAQLNLIQRGDATPAWPYRDTTGQTAPQGSSVYFTAEPKRNN